MDWIHQIQQLLGREEFTLGSCPPRKIPFGSEEPVAGLYCLSTGDFEPEIPNRSGIKIRLSSGLC